MHRIIPDDIAPIIGSIYPAPYDQKCAKRERRRLGDAAGLTQFGVNHLKLPPGSWSSQRHWHVVGDEFIYILAGEVYLVTDGGEEILRAGDAAGFKANVPDGHCLQNRSNQDALILEIGTRAEDPPTYPDIDLVPQGVGKNRYYTHLDGTPY